MVERGGRGGQEEWRGWGELGGPAGGEMPGEKKSQKTKNRYLYRYFIKNCRLVYRR